MDLKRIAVTVMIDLDALPGTMHTPESARENVEAVLLQSFGHYNPVVVLD